MDTTETAMETPDQALLLVTFPTRPSAERGLSENANRTYLRDVDVVVDYCAQAGSAGFSATQRHTDIFVEQLRSAFQHAQPRA